MPASVTSVMIHSVDGCSWGECTHYRTGIRKYRVEPGLKPCAAAKELRDVDEPSE